MRYPALFSLAALLLAGGAFAQSPAPAVSPLDLPTTNDGLPGLGPIRRYDWFKSLWHERRTKWAASVQQDQGAVVFLGDSITQGWNDDFNGLFPELKTANRGISGDTTRGVLLRLREDVLALNPRGVVLLIGTNDLDEAGGNPWNAASNIRLIIDALRQHDPALPVILCDVMPSSAEKNRPACQIRRLNQLIHEAVADQPQVTVVDTWKLFAGPTNDAKPEEFPDLLHPNATGYAKWARAIRPVLATLGLLEQEDDGFTPEPGFVSLFNGHDLTGWGYLPTTPEDIATAKGWQASSADAAAWPVVKEAADFQGRKASPDGRFVATHGRLVVTTPSEGRRIQQLWTTRAFPQNFVLRLQFRATPNTDSGIYIRGPQLQCRDYLLAGPYTALQHYRPLDWNDVAITVKDGTARATCNGEVLEAALPLPATGALGLEGDRGQMEYRRIRLMDLP